jgi:hypothetical protein
VDSNCLKRETFSGFPLQLRKLTDGNTFKMISGEKALSLTLNYTSVMVGNDQFSTSLYVCKAEEGLREMVSYVTYDICRYSMYPIFREMKLVSHFPRASYIVQREILNIKYILWCQIK